jgi:beta-fructofuranosidase
VLSHFRFQAQLDMQGLGKCGLVFRIDPDSRDGYYLSLDLLKGVAQLRAWGTNREATGEHMMRFQSLQSGYWYSDIRQRAAVQLIVFGSYIELSINGRVVLSLADHCFETGQMGVYLETAEVRLSDIQVHRLAAPRQTDEHLASG